MMERPDGYRLWHSAFYAAAPLPSFLVSVGYFRISIPGGGCGCEILPIFFWTTVIGGALTLATVVACAALTRVRGFRVREFCALAFVPYATTVAYTIAVNALRVSPPPLVPIGPMQPARLPDPGVLWLFFIAAGLQGLGLLFACNAPRRRVDPFVCAACGYDLAGLPGDICPECGAPTPNNGDRAIIVAGSGEGAVGTPIDDAGPV